MKKGIIFFILFSIALLTFLNYQLIYVSNDSNEPIYHVKLIAAEQNLNAFDVLLPGEHRYISTNGKWYTLSYSFSYDRINQQDTVNHRVEFWNLKGPVTVKWGGGNYIKIFISSDTVRVEPLIK